jgi:CheY-like chemotaxis protein
MAALETASRDKQQFGLIISDVCMPEVDGFTLCGRIRDIPQYADTPIILLSSALRNNRGAEICDLRISTFLMKPIGWSELKRAMYLVLSENAPEPAAEDPCPKPIPAACPVRTGISAVAAEADRKLRILLAEDNKVNQKVALSMLVKQGYTIVVANNGLEAVEQLQKQSFDLVLMDVQMPLMGGFEATAEIRALERKTGTRVPIVAMTANAMKGDREACIEAGMDGYVAKPVRLKELLAAIESTLSAPLPG